MMQPAVSGCSCHVWIAMFDKTESSINLNPTQIMRVEYAKVRESIRVRARSSM